MQRMVKYSLLVAEIAVILGMAGIFKVRPAQADPHAVFLTVVGQQQLFFNVLAALNQADYVETLQLRQQLAQKRDANYVPSSAQALRDTETNLATLLVRPVTEEGQGLSTQLRSGDYAREVLRQRETGELIKKICQDAFGVKDCVAGQPDVAGVEAEKFVKEPELAFVKDPILHNSLPFFLGTLGSLWSGTDARENLANTLLNKPESLPLAYSETIAKARKALSDLGTGDEAKRIQDYFDGLIAQTVASRSPNILNPDVWQMLRVDNSGRLVSQIGNLSSNPRTGQPLNSDNKVDLYTQALIEIMSTPAILDSIASAAEDRIQQQLFDTVVDGAIPDRVQQSRRSFDGRWGEINTLVSAPANVKVGEQQFSALLPFLVANNPQFADPAQIANPAGAVSAVDEKGAIKIGTPLKPYLESNLIKKGLLPVSGVEDRKGLNRSFFQENVEKILRRI